MKLLAEHKRALELVRRGADRKLARARGLAATVQQVAAGEVAADIAAPPRLALVAAAGDSIANLSPAEQRHLRVKAAATIEELETMVKSLSGSLAEIAERLDELRRHRAAAVAYGKWSGRKARRS